MFVLQTDLTISISSILKQEGFINSFEKDFVINNKYYLCLSLKFKGLGQKPYISVLKRVSKPGLRFYSRVSKIPKILGGIGTSVFVLFIM